MRYKSECKECGKITDTTNREWKRGRINPSCTACGRTLQTKGKQVRKNDRRKQTSKGVKPSVEFALEQLDRVRDLAAKDDIQVVKKAVTNTRGRRDTVHIMFNRGRFRIVDYWPGSGTVMVGGTNGQKKHAESLEQALGMAQKVLEL